MKQRTEEYEIKVGRRKLMKGLKEKKTSRNRNEKDRKERGNEERSAKKLK